MDQLPVSLISTDLKYTLSSLKIKTLQKARQYYVHQLLAIEQGVLDVVESVGVVDKLDKIKKYLAKYDQVRDQVWAKINYNERLGQGLGLGQRQRQVLQKQQYQWQQIEKEQRLIRQQSIVNNNSNNNNTNNSILNQSSSSAIDTSLTKSIKIDQPIISQQPINNNNIQRNITSLYQLITNCLSQPAITQITGLKGTGKSALALYFSQIFPTLTNNNKTLYFLNCSAGITHSRFIRLQQKCPKLQYRDSYQLQHVLKVCDSALKDQHVGCLVIDGLTNLLMEQQKTLVFLLKLFKIFTNLLANRQCMIVITNYVQQLFEHVIENQQLTNHYTYYSSVTSQFIKYKFYLKKQKNSHVKVKLIRGGTGTAEFVIKDDGVMEG